MKMKKMNEKGRQAVINFLSESYPTWLAMADSFIEQAESDFNLEGSAFIMGKESYLRLSDDCFDENGG